MKLSIITINRNNADGLRKTMESVFFQTYRDFEYIVVDGASTDDSLDVIRTFGIQAEGLDFKWISEPDTGIYNAMNKGIEIALGRRIVNSFNRSELVEDKNKGNEDGYVLMLNSADFLVDEHVLESITPCLHEEDVIQGNIIEEYPDKIIRFRGYGQSKLSFLDILEANFPHQAMFIKLSTIEKYGYYDDSYKKGADTYFLITALGLGQATFRYVDIDITNFDINGITNNPMWLEIDRKEDARWFGEHMTEILLKLREDGRQCERLYNKLNRFKLIWFTTKALARVSEWLSPTPSKVKIERIK